jgi:hypothetical protein
VFCKIKELNTRCKFNSTNGCTFKTGSCETIVEKCIGCANIINFKGSQYCKTFPNPDGMWAKGVCKLATHVK